MKTPSGVGRSRASVVGTRRGIGPDGMPKKSSNGTRPGRSSRITDSDEIREVERKALLILLEMFGVVDYVFSEPDAFMEPRRKLRMVYESWKKVRTELDPDFNAHRYSRKKYQ